MATTSDVSSSLPQRARGISTQDLLICLDYVRDDIREDLYSTFAESFQEQFRFTPISIGAPGVALAGVAGDIDNGEYRWRVSFTTPEGETMMGKFSSKLEISDNTSNGQVSLTSVQVGASGTGTTARKIYRQQNGKGDYELVGTISDNTTTTFTDNIAQGALGAAGQDGWDLPSDFYYELMLKDGPNNVEILKRSEVRNEGFERGFLNRRTAPSTANGGKYYAWIDYNDLTINLVNNHNFGQELNLIYRPNIDNVTDGSTLPYPTNLHARLLPILRLGTAFYYLADNKSGEGEMIARLQERYETAKADLFTGSVPTAY